MRCAAAAGSSDDRVAVGRVACRRRRGCSRTRSSTSPCRRRQRARPWAVRGEDDGGGRRARSANRRDDVDGAPPWIRRPRASDARRSRRPNPSTDMTAGGRTSSTSRRPPSRRRRHAQRSMSPRERSTCEQTERLRDAEFVGEERGHRPGATVERVVAAQDEVGPGDDGGQGGGDVGGCRARANRSIRTARDAPAASASRSAVIGRRRPETDHRHRAPTHPRSSSSAISSAASSAGETPAHRVGDDGPPGVADRHPLPADGDRHLGQAHDRAKTTPWPPSGYVQVIAPSLLHTR